MEQKINVIKEIYQTADVAMLPGFIQTYGRDKRSSVIMLVKKAQKQLDAIEKEKKRTEAMKVYEKKYANCRYICGIDEVGRGPLAGPVVAGAVILPKDCEILYLNDSKQLSAKKRMNYTILLWKKQLQQELGMLVLRELMKLIFYRLLMKQCGKLLINFQ